MIRQTCQRCGRPFNPDSTFYSKDVDDMADVSLYIGEWSRSWVLCYKCAMALRGYVADFFEPVTVKASPEPLPRFSPDSCEERVCDGIPEFRTIEETDWFKLPWTPVEEGLPTPLLYVLLKTHSGDICIGYLKRHEEGHSWRRVYGWGSSPEPLMPTRSVAAWAHLPGASDA